MHNLNINHVSQRASQAAPIDSVSEGVKDGVPKPRGLGDWQLSSRDWWRFWWCFLQAIHQLTHGISSFGPGDWPDAGLRQPHSMHFLCCAQFGAGISPRSAAQADIRMYPPDPVLSLYLDFGSQVM